MQLDIARFVDAVDVAEAGSDGKVGGDGLEGLVDLVDVLGLGVEGVVVDGLVVNAVFFAAGDADFLAQVSAGVLLQENEVGCCTISSHCFIGAARLR